MSLTIKKYFSNLIEAAAGKENVLSSTTFLGGFYNGPEDEVIQKEGVAGYFAMLRDAKVKSSLNSFVSLGIPGIVVNPGDDSDKGIRNADFMRDILKAIPGSTIDTLRSPYQNAVVSGMSVVEPQTAVITLPTWGNVIGVTGLNLKPTCSFTDSGDGITTDRFGNIEQFKQGAEYGGHIATIDQVIYYAFQGDANNRYGTSLLNSVYDPWKMKQKIFRILMVLLSGNASGWRAVSLPNKINGRATTNADLIEAQSLLKNMATAQAFAIMKDWDLVLQSPAGDAGSCFIAAGQEMDRQIVSGILGDSAFSAQDQGSNASRMTSQSNVQTQMRAWGDGYMDSFSEQFCPMILQANGFDGPIPVISADLAEDAGSRIEKYKVLGDLRQKGVITVNLPDEAQKKVMQDLGIDGESLKDAETPEPVKAPATIEKVEEPEDDSDEEMKEVNASELIHAAAPSGRDNATLKRNGKQYDKLSKDGAEDLSSTWAEIVPQIMKKLDSQIFNPGLNGWKVTNLNKLRDIAIETTKYKSSLMRKSMDATLKAGNALGDEHARAMVPVLAQERIEAVAGFTPAAVIQSLQNHTYLTLEQKYPKIAGDIYYMLENAVSGDIAPNVVRAQIDNYLYSQSIFASGLTNTIIETSLGSAYNEARMSLFRQVVDTTGNTPGAITGYVFSAIMDNYTSDICSQLDGKAFAADDPSLPQPPLHYNCRSQLIPIFTGETPWTTESKGEITNIADSKAIMANAQAKGWIQPGFGGA